MTKQLKHESYQKVSNLMDIISFWLLFTILLVGGVLYLRHIIWEGCRCNPKNISQI